MRLVLIGKHAHRNENIKHVRNWLQAISSNFSCLFTSQIAKIAKDKCSHCAMDLDYSFRWLSTAPSHRIIALWVHPFSCTEATFWGGTLVLSGSQVLTPIQDSDPIRLATA